MTQVRKNLITNVLSLFVNVLVGVCYTPYLIKTIGVAAYGVIPLSLLLNQYINILANSLTRAVTRFFSVEYKKGDYQQASAYFSSSIIFTAILAIILIPLFQIPIYYIDSLLDIPENLAYSAKWLFSLSVLSFFISVTCNCVNITIFSSNRLDLINYVKIVRHVSKLLINVLLFVLLGANLVWVGCAYLASEMLALITSIIAYVCTKPEGVVFSLRKFQLSMVRPIYSMIAWVALISFADTFIYKIDSILVTNYFGLDKTGILGSMSEFGSYCISITAVIGSLFSPIILIAYSENRHVDVQKLALDGGFVVGMLSCLLCGIVMGASKPILTIWLNDEIAAYSSWMVVKMCVIPFTTIGAVYSCIYNYWNQVRLPALISLTIALLYVVISVILLELGVNMFSFLVFNAFAVILQGYVMNAYMMSKIYPKTGAHIVVKFTRLLLFFFIVFVATKLACGMFTISNVLHLIIILLTIGILGILLGIFILKDNELEMLNLLVPVKGILRYIHH